MPSKFCDYELSELHPGYDGPDVQLNNVTESQILVHFNKRTVSPLDERREVS